MSKWQKVILVAILSGTVSFLIARQRAKARRRAWDEAWARDGETIMEELYKRTNRTDPRLADWEAMLNGCHFGALADYMLGGKDD